jgi:hypothetical protein
MSKLKAQAFVGNGRKTPLSRLRMNAAPSTVVVDFCAPSPHCWIFYSSPQSVSQSTQALRLLFVFLIF